MTKFIACLTLIVFQSVPAFADHHNGGLVEDHETTVANCGVGNYLFRHLKGKCGSSSAQAAPTTAPAAAPAAPANSPMRRAQLINNKIEISDQVTFASGSARLTPAGKKVLDDVAAVITENSAKISAIGIEGHTDHLGNEEKNMSLSGARAESVKSYLVGKGIEKNLFTAKGYGETQPKFNPETASPAEVSANRRVEFKVDMK